MNGHERFLTERDKLVFDKAGYGQRVGFGDRPVVLVIDMNVAACGEESLPILESMESNHNSCGEEAWAAIDVIARLLTTARAKRVPVIHTTGYSRRIAGGFGIGRWADKCANEEPQDPHSNQIVGPVAPLPHEIVIEKTMPSAFFGTDLASYLVNLGADSLIVCGNSTSGCLRATVVDGFSYNYRMIVVEEGSFDRGEASHWISLFDMDMKYADVMTLDAVVTHLEGLTPGLFDKQMPILVAGESAVESALR